MKSNETVESLIDAIQYATGFTLQQIADRIGYQREYLSYAKKSNSTKLRALLKSNFKEDLQKAAEMATQGTKETDWMLLLKEVHSNSIEIRQTVERSEALARANLFQSAKLESLATKESHRSILEGLNKVTAKIFDEMHPELNQTNGEE